MMKFLLILASILLFSTCGRYSGKLNDKDKQILISEVKKMFDNYHSDIDREGLTAEFNYLDSSSDFFWVPPGYQAALSYDSVVHILSQNAMAFSKISFQWDTLQVFPLSKVIATYSGIVGGIMIDTSGVSSPVKIIESGTLIKRKDGWKLLNGQSANLSTSTQAKRSKESENHRLFCYYLTLTDFYKIPENWSAETCDIIEQHAIFLDSLGQSGALILAGRTLFQPGDSRLFGIAILKANNLESAKDILKNDPAVLAGIQKANIYPYSLGIRYLDNLE